MPSKMLLASSRLRRWGPAATLGNTGWKPGVISRALHEKTVIAIRREDNSVWERRAPLAPMQVKKLIRTKPLEFIVQPSNRRAYAMDEYLSAGATVQEDISQASLILGVKTVPIDQLYPNKTYAFFSHTIKAQEANMPLLDAVLAKNIRLIDYEKMTDDRGIRTVAFGKYAGVAGMINILNGLGLRLLALGHHTPFMYIAPAHNYRNNEMARQAVRDAGYSISLGLMPKSMGPLTFVFLGAGNVSEGAQEVFRELPFEMVDPHNLKKVSQEGSTKKVYGCVVDREHHLVRKDGGAFDVQEFEEHPERYASMFARQMAPYASCIINGIYYAPNDPRLITIPDTKNLLAPKDTPWIPTSPGCPNLPHRLLAVCDISADPGGSLEFMKECTTIDKPFCLYDAGQNMNYESFSGNGVLICSIDNMPAQIPREATDYFGGLLLPYIEDMAISDATQPFEQYGGSRVVKDAVIASNGTLTPKYTYISDLREEKLKAKCASRMSAGGRQKALVLGSGFVSAPCVDYLNSVDVECTVVSNMQQEAEALSSRFPLVSAKILDVSKNLSEFANLVKDVDLVISLLPYSLHPMIAKVCIAEQKNMVTASYLSPAMKELHGMAEDAGITVLNEVGVDPGIDHFLAMDVFEDAKRRGGKISSYVSWCGGLPAPEFSANPLRYKFSWSPAGVLLALSRPAKYMQDGQIQEVAEGQLLKNVQELSFMPAYQLEGYPNGNSLNYKDLYGIDTASTVLRGTIRYKGFRNAAQAIINLGLTDTERMACLHPSGPPISWKELIAENLNQKRDILADTLKDLVFEKFEKDKEQYDSLDQLGFFSEEEIEKRDTPVETTSNYLAKRLSFGKHEYDLLLMHHEIGVVWPDMKSEVHHVDLTVYGDSEENGYSAMAKTVGYPIGISAKMVLDGEIQEKGMVLPLSSHIYQPIMQRLEQLGIRARGHVVSQ